MQEIKVKEDDLVNYTYGMVRYAVYEHPDEVMRLLEVNGVHVPEHADYKILHAMTLKAMTNSATFNKDFQQLLNAIAMDAQYSKYKHMEGSFANQTGADATAPKTDDSQKGSWFQQTFNPKTVDALLAGGIALVTAQLHKNGDAGIKSQVDNGAPTIPPPPKTKTNSKTPVIILGVSIVAGIAGYVYWKNKNK